MNDTKEDFKDIIEEGLEDKTQEEELKEQLEAEREEESELKTFKSPPFIAMYCVLGISVLLTAYLVLTKDAGVPTFTEEVAKLPLEEREHLSEVKSHLEKISDSNLNSHELKVEMKRMNEAFLVDPKDSSSGHIEMFPNVNRLELSQNGQLIAKN